MCKYTYIYIYIKKIARGAELGLGDSGMDKGPVRREMGLKEGVAAGESPGDGAGQRAGRGPPGHPDAAKHPGTNPTAPARRGKTGSRSYD